MAPKAKNTRADELSASSLKISRQEHHDQIAGAMKAALISPNEPDRDGEPANIVDGLFAIARAIDGLTAAIRKATGTHNEDD